MLKRPFATGCEQFPISHSRKFHRNSDGTIIVDFALTQTYMLKNFFRSAFRRLLRNRLYTFMNIIGLSVGLACFAMIGMWVKHQYSYDQMHGNAQRIFQVNESISGEREKFRQAITAAPLAAALISECPEIDRTLRLDLFNAVVQHGAQQFVEKKNYRCGPFLLCIF